MLTVSELTEKKVFIRSFIQGIKVVGDEATLTYVMPLNGLIEQKIGVLPIVQYGRPYSIRTFLICSYFGTADNQEKVNEKILGESRFLRRELVLGIVPFGGDRVSIGRTFSAMFESNY